MYAIKIMLSDINNNPAFKSCLLRIPFNSKHDEQNREVKIIHQWDGFRPRINSLLYHFYIYLADRKLKEFNNMRKNQTESHYTFRGNTIPWIEKLLETPIDDYRKNAVNLILAPYLINIKKLPYDAALYHQQLVKQMWKINIIRSKLQLYGKVCYKELCKEWI